MPKLNDYQFDAGVRTGVCNGTDACTPSNTDNLPKCGYFSVTGAGNVKFDPIEGTAGQVRAFAAGETSRFRVKKIYDTLTTATGIYIYW